MFTEIKNIIYIARNTVEGARVELGAVPLVKERYKIQWVEENLKDQLSTVLKKLKTNKIRLLLADDIVYTQRFSIPSDLHGDKERRYVFEKLQAVIPEDLSDKDWDYREVSSGNGEKNVLVFIPVKSKFQIISKAFLDLGCSVEAVEPDEAARARSDDPVIGTALKKDLKGADEETLNLSLVQEVASGIKSKENLPNPKNHPDKKVSRKFRPVLLLPLAVILVLAVYAISAGYISPKKGNSKNPAVEQKDNKRVEETPEPSPTPQPTPTPAPAPALDLTGLRIKVLNGSGTSGKAASVAKLLEQEGIKNVDIGNADRSDYTQTVVQTKNSEISGQIISKIEQILKGYKVQVEGTLTQDLEFDLLIIVGKE